MGRCGYYLLFHPWIYVTTLNVILDAVASGFFIWDLVNTTVKSYKMNLTFHHFSHIYVRFQSWSSFLLHLEVSNGSTLPTISDEYILAIPSIIMLCIAARLLIFWIMNIAFIPIVLSLGKKAVFGEIVKAKRESVQLNARPAFEQANPHNNNQMGYMIGAGIIRDNGNHPENEVGH